MFKVPDIKMNNGLIMPGFGLGTFQVSFLLYYYVLVFLLLCFKNVCTQVAYIDVHKPYMYNL